MEVHKVPEFIHVAIHNPSPVASDPVIISRPSTIRVVGHSSGGVVLATMSADRMEEESLNPPIDVALAVGEFHKAFNLPVRERPGIEVDPALAKLRVVLLEEEVSEFVSASEQGDLVGIADALADIVYVVYGTALTYGIDLDSVVSEVHRSNMSKLGKDGRPILRSDGKVVKSDQYFRPDIATVLDRQRCAEGNGAAGSD